MAFTIKGAKLLTPKSERDKLAKDINKKSGEFMRKAFNEDVKGQKARVDAFANRIMKGGK